MAVVTRVAHEGGIITINKLMPAPGAAPGTMPVCKLDIDGAEGASRIVSVVLDRHQLHAHIAGLLEVHEAMEAAHKAAKVANSPMGGLLDLLKSMGDRPTVDVEATQAPQPTEARQQQQAPA
jgi:hypothetical protein